jgi:hypothetical protein
MEQAIVFRQPPKNKRLLVFNANVGDFISQPNHFMLMP